VFRIPVFIIVLLTCPWHEAVAGTDPGLDQSGGQIGEPVSADRVRDGLRRPELQIPVLPPPPVTFRIEVEEKLETPLDVIRRELQEEASARWRIPTRTGIDLMPALVGLVAKIKDIRRQHAEADAREMVKAELAEFCTTHDCSEFESGPISEGVIVTQ
jgi:hypothetical protein